MISEQSNPAGQEENTSVAPATTAVNMDENAAEFRFNEAPGFGSRLRAVREARGLDLETCGHALRLPVRVLRQLENNEFDGLDYQVYIGGYIRKYARYLEIDDAEAEAAVGGLKPVEPPLVATGGVSHSRYLLDRYATAATYVVLTLVIAVPTVWLGMRGTLTHDMSHLAPLDAAPVAQQDAPPPAPAASGSTAKAPTGNVAGLAQAGNTTPAAAPATRPVEQQPLLASMVPVPNLDSDANVTPSPASAVDPASVGSGSHSLTLSLPNSSWVEVIGKDGSRLEYGLLPAGTAKTYHSDQPLEVRIGNATGAQVSVDGQPMVLDPYRRSNVAHFRVDIQDGKAAPAGA
jgi:cytoskeleton protein RodZ